MSLAGCHHPGVLVHSQPTLLAILGLTVPVAGWPSPGPQASAAQPPIHSCPQPLPVVMPSAILPQHSSFIHPTSHSGASRPHSRHWDYSSGQAHLGQQSFYPSPSMAPRYLQDGVNPTHAFKAVNLGWSSPLWTPAPPQPSGQHPTPPPMVCEVPTPVTVTPPSLCWVPPLAILSPLCMAHFHCSFRISSWSPLPDTSFN